MKGWPGEFHDAARLLLKSPGFTVAAIATLALGIGANAAVFSVADTVLLKPLPYPDADRIVVLTTRTPQGSSPGLSMPKLTVLRESEPESLQDLAAYRFRVVNVRTETGTHPGSVGEVSADFFQLFGASFEQGRSFTSDEGRSRSKVAIVSSGLALRSFAHSANVVGKAVWLDGEALAVVGVLKSTFDAQPLAGPVLGSPDVWTPLAMDESRANQSNTLFAAARLAPGVTLQHARTRLQRATERFIQAFPGVLGSTDVFDVEGLRDQLVGDVRSSLIVLEGAVGFVLLVACANVACLFLVRSTGRARETAIKVALGAGRGQIMREVLAESLLLSFAGGLLGLWLGVLGIRALLNFYPNKLGWIGSAVLDANVVAFVAVVTAVAAAAAGLVPASVAFTADLHSALRATGSTATQRQKRIRSVFVGAEIALAVVLLIGAGLLGRTFLAFRSLNPGFDARDVLTMRLPLGDPSLISNARVQLTIRNGIERIGSIQGVAVASATCCMPLENDTRLRFVIVGRPLSGPYHGMGSWRSVSAGYFEALRIPIVRGRWFTADDRAGAAPVAIINRAMAAGLWPDGDPLADSLLIGRGLGPQFASEPTRRIVGIVGDVRDATLSAEPRPTIYVPIAQLPDSVMRQAMGFLPLTWIVRTSADSAGLRRSIQRELEMVAGSPVAEVEPLTELVRSSTSDNDFYLAIMSLLGAAALLLAWIGVNGVASYATQHRHREVAIRLALGAEPVLLRNMLLWQGLQVVLLSVPVGIGVALVMGRIMRGLLVGVSGRDPVVFVAVPAVVMVTALLAVWLPVRAAVGTDPATVLRST